MCSNGILYLFFSVFDHMAANTNEASMGIPLNQPFVSYKRWFRVYVLLTVFLSILCGYLLALFGVGHNLTRSFASILEITASLLICVHWLPQLRTTWKVGRAGSLSVLTLGIQAGGAGGAAYVGYHSSRRGELLWVPYVIVGVLQTLLLAEMGSTWGCTPHPATCFFLKN